MLTFFLELQQQDPILNKSLLSAEINPKRANAAIEKGQTLLIDLIGTNLRLRSVPAFFGTAVDPGWLRLSGAATNRFECRTGWHWTLLRDRDEENIIVIEAKPIEGLDIQFRMRETKADDRF